MPTSTSIGGRVTPKTPCAQTTCAVAVLSELVEHPHRLCQAGANTQESSEELSQTEMQEKRWDTRRPECTGICCCITNHPALGVYSSSQSSA